MNHKINLIFVFCLLFFVLNCGGESKFEEVKSGRLRFVKTLRYGLVGTHGSKGWYVSDRKFFVNDKNWSPENVDVKEDVSYCEPSPNESLELLKCESYSGSKGSVFILRFNGENPEWIKASDAPYGRGNNFGEWTGKGRWLLFRKYFFNVETSEKKEIKDLPSDPGEYFRAASPDLRTIVFEETCYPADEGRKGNEQICKDSNERHTKGLAGYLLIDAETGKREMFELKKDKFDWLFWDRKDFATRAEWLAFFQSKFVWEKDKSGKYKLIAPTNL